MASPHHLLIASVIAGNGSDGAILENEGDRIEATGHTGKRPVSNSGPTHTMP